jgi:hypothetical protein
MAAGPTYEPIATTTLGSAASTITFSSIAATYTDIRIVFASSKATSGTTYPVLVINDDNAGSSYSQTNLRANGSTVVSNRSTNAGSGWDFGYNGVTTVPTLLTADFFSYAGSTNKTCLMTNSDNRNGSGNSDRYVGLWRNTAAITKIAIVGSSNFAIGTTATLYGIKNA